MGAADGEGIDRDAVDSSCEVESGGRDVWSISETMHSLLGAWKGRFKKVLGELDQVIVAVWVGLVQLGLGRGPIERNLGTWTLRRAQSCRKAKPKMRFFAKGPRQPSPVNKPRSAPTSEVPVTLMKVMLEVPPTVGWVSGMSETMTDVLTADSPLAGPVSEILARVLVGSNPIRSGCVDGANSPSI